MNLYNLFMLMRMAFDKNIIILLFKMWLYFRHDPNFSKFKAIKTLLLIFKNDKIIKHEGKYVLTNFLPPVPSEAIWNNFKAIEIDDPKTIYTQHHELKRKAPISTYLCVTTRCPNNCEYCSVKHREEYKNELTTRQWIEICKKLQDSGVSIIGFTGGEPLVRKDIFDIVKSIDERSISLIFTSGKGLTYTKALKLKNAGLFGLGISIDSHFNSHERFRNSTAAIKMSKWADLYTCVHIVVVKEDINEHNLLNLFRYLKSIGANELRLFEPIYSGKLLESQNLNKIMYNEEDRKEMLRIQEKANKKIRGLKVSSDFYNESKEKYGCSAGTQHSYINPIGDLYPCDFFPMKFGNLLEDDFTDIYIKMKDTIKYPKTFCLAQKFNKQFSNIKINEVVDISDIIIDDDIPMAYKKLKGIK